MQDKPGMPDELDESDERDTGVAWTMERGDYGHVAGLAVAVYKGGKTLIRDAVSTQGYATVRPAVMGAPKRVPAIEAIGRMTRDEIDDVDGRMELVYDYDKGEWCVDLPGEVIDPGELRRRSDEEIRAMLQPKLEERLRAIAEAGEIVRTYLAGRP